ncbi:hypothetical protein EDD85DRAFT_797483 [Armillaria nabsnona]|nr:hypothetical protein EDD85DRAFT_797483 [Armillaria nabsnona]
MIAVKHMGIRDSRYYLIAREAQVQGHLERVRHVKQSPIPLHVVFPGSASGGGVYIISAKTNVISKGQEGIRLTVYHTRIELRRRFPYVLLAVRSRRSSEKYTAIAKSLRQGRKTSILKNAVWRPLAADIILSNTSRHTAQDGLVHAAPCLWVKVHGFSLMRVCHKFIRWQDERMASADGTDSENSVTLNHVLSRLRVNFIRITDIYPEKYLVMERGGDLQVMREIFANYISLECVNETA